MSKEEENTAVPSYSRVIDNSREYVAESRPQESPTPESKAPEGEKSEAPASEGQPGAAVAADQAAAQAEQSPAEAKATVGAEEAPSYIKDIQSQLAALNQQLASGQGAQGEAGDPLVQIEQQLVDLQKQAEDGEITYSEMIRQTTPLIEQRTAIKVKQDIQQEAEAEQIRGAQDAFLAENPDFMEFAKSPEAAAIRQANPLLDNVSAYYAYKAKSSEAAIGSLQQQFNELKAQMESSIKGAAKEQASVVGTGTGEESNLPKLGKGDGLRPFEGGMAALQRVRIEK